MDVHDTNKLQRAHIINPIVPGLQGAKMSSSDPGMLNSLVI